MERNEIQEAFRWKLEDIFSTDQEWEAEFLRVKGGIPGITAYAGRIGEGPAVLAEALAQCAGTDRALSRLYCYAHMRMDENNAVSLYQTMTSRAESAMVEYASAASFLDPEILSLPEETLTQWMKEPALEPYRRQLQELQRKRAHVLSPEEERILALAGEVLAGPNNAYSMLDYVDLKFPDVQGSPLTLGRFGMLLEDPRQQVRKEAFEALYSTYAAYNATFGALLSSSVRGDVFRARASRYGSSLEMALFPDNVPVSVYENLIAAVHRKLPALERYLRLKKKMLGVEELHLYDLYAPLSTEADMGDCSFDAAFERVCEGLAPLGETYISELRQGKAQRWMDVYETPGKTTGAYSWGCYDSHPYILLNHREDLDGIFTMAHELGHSLHSLYSNRAQEYVNSQYPTLLAEVASTVNEMLLIEDMIDKETDRNRRILLLNHLLEQFRTTVFRQVMFAEFEKTIHEKAEAGEALSGETLSEIYLELNRTYYGNEAVIDSGVAFEWQRISHFYNAFYVYMYATGFSSAVAIARKIRQEGEPAAKNYREQFLSAGGSSEPLEILRRVGIDLTTPQPVEAALEVFEQTLGLLEELAGQKGAGDSDV